MRLAVQAPHSRWGDWADRLYIGCLYSPVSLITEEGFMTEKRKPGRPVGSKD